MFSNTVIISKFTKTKSFLFFAILIVSYSCRQQKFTLSPGTPKPPFKTMIAAHRGANQLAPENTLAAFQKAIDLGVDFIEIDVRLTADNHMVIMHDATLDRTTEGHGLVKQTPWDSIKKYSAGKWFGEAFADQKIPSLEELCAFVSNYRGRRKSEVKLYVDCKEVDGKRLVGILQRHNLLNGAVFYGSPDVLLAIRQFYHKAKLMPGLSDITQMDKLATQLNPYAFDVKWSILSDSLINRIHDKGIKVFSDGIGKGNEGVEVYMAGIRMGVDLIQTDHIHDVQAAITRVNNQQ